MQYALSFCLSVILLTGCSGNSDKPENPGTDSISSETPVTSTVSTSGCYQNQGGTDSIYLQLVDSAGIITGELEYRLTGKDANKGSISGRMRGDTLIAEYSFQSEGQSSLREIAFLRRDSTLIEGFGPVHEINGAMRFSATDSLTFNEVNALSKVPCRN